MNIIICGAGRVGFTIAKLLSEQGHSITVIDQSSEVIQKLNEALDVKAIVGKATSPIILAFTFFSAQININVKNLTILYLYLTVLLISSNIYYLNLLN